MTKRVCIEDGCPVLTDATRCADHTKRRDHERGTRQQRGYDAAYDAARRDYQRRMDQGERFNCWRCAELGHLHHVDPTRWHLGHSNEDRSVIRGPQCPQSNLDTSAMRISSMTYPPTPRGQTLPPR